ncbi:MAG TPA: preprotein translocase YidC [Actinoplanes sp.]|jgi:hypothetical protein
MTANQGNRNGELPVDPAVKQEDGAPLTQVDTDRRPVGMPDSDIVTEPDGSGTAGGASGSSGGGSSMPGHPDAAH